MEIDVLKAVEIIKQKDAEIKELKEELKEIDKQWNEFVSASSKIDMENTSNLKQENQELKQQLDKIEKIIERWFKNCDRKDKQGWKSSVGREEINKLKKLIKTQRGDGE